MLKPKPPSAPVLLAALSPYALLAVPMQAAANEITVQALYETDAHYDDEAGGKANADDPAIWVHPFDRSRSLIVATLKEGGLAVYDLHGKTLQRIAAPPAPTPDDAPGRFNNVDLLSGFPLQGRAVDLAVVTDRGHDRLRFYRIDPDYRVGGQPPLRDVTDAEAPWIFSRNQGEVNAQQTAYGLAVAHWPGLGGAYGVVSQREQSRLAQVRFIAVGERVGYRVSGFATLPSSFTLPDRTAWTPCQDEDGVAPQVEGMVINPLTGTLYAAQEQVGIWRIPFGDPARASLIDRVRSYGTPYTRVWDAEEEEFACTDLTDRDRGYGGTRLTADAEGLTLYHGLKASYLLASSQGDNRFAVYDIRRQHRFLGRFAMVDGGKTDGVQHSDGAAVTSLSLGSDFPGGLLVVHDGDNTPRAYDGEGEARENTNFKLIPWQDIARRFDPPLDILPAGWWRSVD